MDQSPAPRRAVRHPLAERAPEPVARPSRARATADGVLRAARSLPAALVVAVALGVVVAWAGSTALAPSSLWIDDAWVALAAKADTPGQLVHTMVTAHGFTVLLWGWLRAVGIHGLDGAAPQALALAAGMAAPGVLWLGLRRWARWGVVPALAAATLVATSPLVVVFSTRVKHYTLDVLLAALLTTYALGLVGDLGDRPGGRRWRLTIGACLAIVMSAAMASVAGAAVAVAWVAAMAGAAGSARQVRPRHVLRTAAPVAAFGAFALAWQVGVLAHTIPTGMYTFWQDQFLPVDEGAAAVTDAMLAGLGDAAAATIALPVGVTVLLVAIGLLRRAPTRAALAGVVLLPVLASLVLALLQQAPWGGGRTDSHLVVAFAVAVGAALAAPTRGRRWVRWPAVGLAGALVVALAASALEQPSYPREDLRPLVTIVDEGHRPDEVILVYPFARLAWALYTPAPVEFRANDGSSIGYAVEVDDPRVVLLPAWRRDPSRYARLVATATDGWCGVWLPASHVGSDLAAVKAALVEAGFRQEGDGWAREGATLSHWRRDAGC